MRPIILALAAASVFLPCVSADVILDANVNTTALNGMAGYLAFDFLGGTPIEGNIVIISGFTTNATLGALMASGDAVGTVSPGPGTLDDGQFFNEFLQAITFGTLISFAVDLTTTETMSGIPDNFSFYLLDSMQDPFITSDPTGADSLFSINVTGPSLTPDIYSSSSATATLTPISVATPEPNSFWSLFIFVLLFSLVRLRRGAAF